MFTMQQLFYWWPLGSSFQAFLIAARLSSGALLLGQTEVLKVFTICDAGDLTLEFFGSSSSSRSPPPEDFPSAWSPPPRSAWRPHPPPPTPSRPSRPTGSMISCPRWGLATVYEKHSEQKTQHLLTGWPKPIIISIHQLDKEFGSLRLYISLTKRLSRVVRSLINRLKVFVRAFFSEFCRRAKRGSAKNVPLNVAQFNSSAATMANEL